MLVIEEEAGAPHFLLFSFKSLGYFVPFGLY